MKKIIFFAIPILFFTILAQNTYAAPQCSGNTYNQNSDPACWTSSTVSCEWITLAYIYNCTDGSGLCTGGNPPSHWYHSALAPLCSSRCPNNIGPMYHIWALNTCGGGVACSNGGLPDYGDKTTYVCHYIEDYGTWTGCIGGVSYGSNPIWKTVEGKNCSDVYDNTDGTKICPSCGTLDGELMDINEGYDAYTKCTPGSSMVAAFSWNESIQAWEWTCKSSTDPSLTSPKCYVYKPAKCGDADGKYDYSYTETGPTGELCAGGISSPTNPQFPVNGYGTDNLATWTCNGAQGTEDSCEAARILPTIKCGTAVDEKINIAPTQNLCSADPGTASVNPPPYFVETGNDAGNWVWGCEHDDFPLRSTNQIVTAADACMAESCLSNNPLNYPSNVYLGQNGQDATISVECSGRNICCSINGHQIEIDGEQRNFICTGDNGEINVVPGETYTAQCWFDDDEDGNPDEEGPITYDFNINTMCASKSCNAQGTCQSTPVQANSLDASQCKSSCNSNADCTKGRLIETKP